MNEKHGPADVPFIVVEAERATAERTNRRMAILCGIAIAALVLSNAAWSLRALQII